MKYYKLFLCLALIGIFLFGLFPYVTAHADTPAVEVSEGTWVVVDQPLTIPQLIARYSALYGVSYEKLYGTLKCESKFNPRAVSPTQDYGIAQIHLASWPSITKEEAFDPEFGISFSAKQFSLGNASAWTCYRLLYT